MIRLAVFGSPVEHSLSPRIHRLFASQCNLEVDYRAIEANDRNFPRLARELAESGGRGCNVTVPLKAEAWRLAGRASDDAQRARAANTLVFCESWQWYADNTDGRGLLNDLDACGSPDLDGAAVCLLGAGGAAAGVLAALLGRGPRRLTIVNRTLRRARALIESHADLGALECCRPGEAGDRGPFDLLINATSLGHQGSAPELSSGWLRPGGLCYDLNYRDAAEPLRSLCSSLAFDYRDGLGMLVEQAGLSFALWTGQTPRTRPVVHILREGN